MKSRKKYVSLLLALVLCLSLTACGGGNGDNGDDGDDMIDGDEDTATAVTRNSTDWSGNDV